MNDIQVRITEIEKELRETPHHKATDHHIGRLRAKLALLRQQSLEDVQKRKGGGGGYFVRKSGDATVVLVGPPSVGKSSLLNVLTDAESAVAAYDFTTLSVVPGMMSFRGAKIQIFDLPGIIEGASRGKGRGREVLAVARAANLLVIVIDHKTMGFLPMIKRELWQFGFRLGEERPKLRINKKTSGGLKITSTVPLNHLTRETIKEVVGQFRIVNAEIVIKEDMTVDRLIDGLVSNRVFLPYLVVINKSDLKTVEVKLEGAEPLLVSALTQKNLEKLKELIWERLKIIRVYLKEKPGEEPGFTEPLILSSGETVAGAVGKISSELVETVKSARIWGRSAKYPGQKVSLKHILKDEDILYLLK